MSRTANPETHYPPKAGGGDAAPVRPGEAGAPSWASSPAVRRSMQGNRSRDTRPEMALRRRLHAAGLRFRVCRRPEADLPFSADVVFTRARVAVFLHGCFWHRCPVHASLPRTNQPWWFAKLARNVARDAKAARLLTARGWRVVTVWEHQPPDEAARHVLLAVLTSSRLSRGVAA